MPTLAQAFYYTFPYVFQGLGLSLGAFIPALLFVYLAYRLQRK